MANWYCHYLILGCLWYQHVYIDQKEEKTPLCSHLVYIATCGWLLAMLHCQQPWIYLLVFLSLIPFLLVFRMLLQWWYGHNVVVIFPNHALPRRCITFFKFSQQAGIFYRLSIIPLLGFDLYLHMGWSPPSFVYIVYQIGPNHWVWYFLWCWLLHPQGGVQRSSYPKRGLGQSKGKSLF